MKLVSHAGLTVALSALLASPASAQWQTSIGPGTRNATHTEYDTSGRRMVREAGWLPGVALGAAWQMGDVTWLAAADGYRGDIDYHGQTQAGVRADSTTSTRLVSMRIGAAYALGQGYAALAAVELDRWQRTIHSVGSSIGLQESYRSHKLVAGTSKSWRLEPGQVRADAAFILSAPERMHVGFSGMFDPASFDTRRGHGARLGASLVPAFAPHLELCARYDWIRIPRSADAPLTRNGQFWGTVAQPEHERQAFTLTVSALF